MEILKKPKEAIGKFPKKTMVWTVFFDQERFKSAFDNYLCF